MSSTNERSSETDLECLTNAEVAIVLNKLKEAKKGQFDEHFEETLKGVKRFSGTLDPISNETHVRELREALEKESITVETIDGDFVQQRLTQKEIVALANLKPMDTEEAKCLIPTLKHLKEEELSRIISKIQD